MSLLDVAAADLRAILSDVDSGFAVPIRVISPEDTEVTVNGLATDIGMSFDPETGQAIAGRRASVALPIAELEAAGSEEPRGAPSGRPWRLAFALPHAEERIFKVASVMPDKLGCLVCFIEDYRA